MQTDLARSLHEIQAKIRLALDRARRSAGELTLVAVSKKQPAGLIRAAFELGIGDLGENYAQELLGKREELAALPIRWHFIGHLQRRKAKEIVGKVHLIHSLDSAELAGQIDQCSAKRGIVQDCLLQVSLAGEAAKSGIPPEKAESLLRDLSGLRNIRVLGLMTLPPAFEDPEQSRPFFKTLRELRDELNARGAYPEKLAHLSMGMSHDFGVAIEEGATLIRVGTALFGRRA